MKFFSLILILFSNFVVFSYSQRAKARLNYDIMRPEKKECVISNCIGHQKQLGKWVYPYIEQNCDTDYSFEMLKVESDCVINSVEGGFFDKFKSLEEIDITDNMLTQIYHSNKELKVLNIPRNKFSSIKDIGLPLNKIEHLYIYDNDLKYFEYQLTQIPNIKTLFIQLSGLSILLKENGSAEMFSVPIQLTLHDVEKEILMKRLKSTNAVIFNGNIKENFRYGWFDNEFKDIICNMKLSYSENTELRKYFKEVDKFTTRQQNLLLSSDDIWSPLLIKSTSTYHYSSVETELKCPDCPECKCKKCETCEEKSCPVYEECKECEKCEKCKECEVCTSGIENQDCSLKVEEYLKTEKTQKEEIKILKQEIKVKIESQTKFKEKQDELLDKFNVCQKEKKDLEEQKGEQNDEEFKKITLENDELKKNQLGYEKKIKKCMETVNEGKADADKLKDCQEKFKELNDVIKKSDEDLKKCEVKLKKKDGNVADENKQLKNKVSELNEEIEASKKKGVIIGVIFCFTILLVGYIIYYFFLVKPPVVAEE